MQSTAQTVSEYLASLPEDRRLAITKVREVVLEALPEGYEEVMNWGMISYQIPLSRYPNTYNKQPLMYAALASQKNYMALYLMTGTSPEGHKQFEADWKATGKKLNMGKSCIRFKSLDDVALDVVAKTIAANSVDDFVEYFEHAQADRKQARARS